MYMTGFRRRIPRRKQAAPYSYFIDELIDQVINDLQVQKGYTEVQAQNALYSGGLRIYTTQDPVIQGICDDEYANPDNFPEESQVGIDWALSVKNGWNRTKLQCRNDASSFQRYRS